MNREIALQRSKEEWDFLEKHPEWNNDKEIILEAIEENYSAFQFVSQTLKDDKDFTLKAIQKCGLILSYVSNKFIDDKDFILKAIRFNVSFFRYASNKLKKDHDVALETVKNGDYLPYLTRELQEDKEIVLAAVQHWGMALGSASDELRKDKEIVLTAVKNNAEACKKSLLEGYQNFDQIVKKEGEEFLFSCWNNYIFDVKLQVANHSNFLPTVEQIEAILQGNHEKYLKKVYYFRQDEWLAKMEENKLRNTV